MSMPSERGLLVSMTNINKEDKIRINVMGQVLSCPQFIFRTTLLTDGETEATQQQWLEPHHRGIQDTAGS